MSEITRWLQESRVGNRTALDSISKLIFDDLRRRAAVQLRREGRFHTLQPTELVHETYLRLAGSDEWSCKDRDHFLALATITMRRILVEHARRKRAAKRGSGWVRVHVDELAVAGDGAQSEVDVLELEDWLEVLEGRGEPYSRWVQTTRLRVYGGMKFEQIGRTLGVSTRTAQYDFAKVVALMRELST